MAIEIIQISIPRAKEEIKNEAEYDVTANFTK